MAKYQFNTKGEENKDWGDSVSGVISNYVLHNCYCDFNSLSYADHKIEDKIEHMTYVVGNLAQILTEKGLLSPEEVLKIIGINPNYSPLVYKLKDEEE